MGNHDACQTRATGESIATDEGYAVWERNTLQASTVCKCVLFHIGYGIRDCDTGQVAAVFECCPFNTSNAILDCDIRQFRAAIEDINDTGYTLRDRGTGQAGTVLKYIRSDFLYDERGDNKPYSFIHQNSLSTYLGMDDNAHGKTYGSVLVKNIERDSFKMVFETLGDLVSSNAALGFQVDYQSSNGQYKKSVIYKMNGFDAKMDIPFSIDANPTIKTFPKAQHGKVLVQLKQDAPADWNNAIRITCFIKDTGNNTSVRFQVN